MPVGDKIVLITLAGRRIHTGTIEGPPLYLFVETHHRIRDGADWTVDRAESMDQIHRSIIAGPGLPCQNRPGRNTGPESLE